MFCFQARLLNFNENIGISATSDNDIITTKMKRYAALKESDIRKECAPTVNDPQNKALAGVGIPMKLLLWRGSILNLPKRKAENTEIRNAV